MISPVPDVKTLQLDAKRDSFILLACDGIWNSLSSQETVDFVQQRLLKLENEAKKDPSTQQLKKICEEVCVFIFLLTRCMSAELPPDIFCILHPLICSVAPREPRQNPALLTEKKRFWT